MSLPTSHRPTQTARSSKPSDSPPAPASRLLVRVADGFAFSGGLAAAVAALLSGVSSQALGAPTATTWAVLAASGAFIVYALDRLRDIDRDLAGSPLRTAFIVRNRSPLTIAIGLAAIGLAVSLVQASASIVLLCVAIGGIGLFHRRLKENTALKTAYVSLAWVGACAGMPWLASGLGRAGFWVSGILLASLLANLIASNLQDHEPRAGSGFDRSDPATILWLARGVTLAGIAIGLAAPAAFRPMVWIPVCEGVALAAYRPTERYGQFAIDGALLIGAIVTMMHFAMAG